MTFLIFASIAFWDLLQSLCLLWLQSDHYGSKCDLSPWTLNVTCITFHVIIIIPITVVQVCGYRLRLHFDGYSDCHDFWVNANSADIHPPGWCESTGHKLQTPKGQSFAHTRQTLQQRKTTALAGKE